MLQHVVPACVKLDLSASCLALTTCEGPGVRPVFAITSLRTTVKLRKKIEALRRNLQTGEHISDIGLTAIGASPPTPPHPTTLLNTSLRGLGLLQSTQGIPSMPHGVDFASQGLCQCSAGAMQPSGQAGHQIWPQQMQQGPPIKQEPTPHAYANPKQEPTATAYPQAYPTSTPRQGPGGSDGAYAIPGCQPSVNAAFSMQGELQCPCRTCVRPGLQMPPSECKLGCSVPAELA